MRDLRRAENLDRGEPASERFRRFDHEAQLLIGCIAQASNIEVTEACFGILYGRNVCRNDHRRAAESFSRLLNRGRWHEYTHSNTYSHLRIVK